MQPQRTASGLLAAVQRGAKSDVQRLIRKRANVSESDSDGFTCLMEAAANNHISILILLLESKADPAPINRLGRSVLMEAAARGHSAIVLRLAQAHPPLNEVNEKHSLKLTALMEAASRGHTGAAFWLCEARADIDARNAHGDTALIMAAHNGRLNTVQMLIGQRANPMLVGDGGMNALQAAAANGHLRIAEFLSDPRLIELDFCNEIYCRFKSEFRDQLQDEVNYDASVQIRPVPEPTAVRPLPKWTQTLIKIPLGLDRSDRTLPLTHSNVDLLDVTRYPNHYLRNPWYSVNLTHIGQQAQSSAFVGCSIFDQIANSPHVPPPALRKSINPETISAFNGVMVSQFKDEEQIQEDEQAMQKDEENNNTEGNDREKKNGNDASSLNKFAIKFTATSLKAAQRPKLIELPKPSDSRISYSRTTFGFLNRHYAPRPLQALPKFGECTWIATEPTRVARESRTERIAAFIRTLSEAHEQQPEWGQSQRPMRFDLNSPQNVAILDNYIKQILGEAPELQTEEYVNATKKLKDAVKHAVINAGLALDADENIEYPRLTLYDNGTWKYSGDRLSGELEGTFELFLLATTSPQFIPSPPKLKSENPDRFAGARRGATSKEPSFFVMDMTGSESLAPEMMVESETTTSLHLEAKAEGKLNSGSDFVLDRLTPLSPAHTRPTYYVRLTTCPRQPTAPGGFTVPVQVVGCVLAKQLVLGKLVMEMHELAVPWWEM